MAVAFFMESLDTTILNTAVPAIAAAIHVAPLSMKAVLASYTLRLAVLIPIRGWMADRFGTRRVFASAMKRAANKPQGGQSLNAPCDPILSAITFAHSRKVVSTCPPLTSIVQRKYPLPRRSVSRSRRKRRTGGRLRRSRGNYVENLEGFWGKTRPEINVRNCEGMNGFAR